MLEQRKCLAIEWNVAYSKVPIDATPAIIEQIVTQKISIIMIKVLTLEAEYREFTKYESNELLKLIKEEKRGKVQNYFWNWIN